MTRSRFVLAVLTFLGNSAAAQEIRGTVVDSASRRPIVGAVLLYLDSAGATLGRSLTNENGEYRVSRSAQMQSIRVMRMGYRPRTIAISSGVGFEARMDFAVAAIPRLLEAVDVVASNLCPRRADAPIAQALLQRAREGLLVTVVSREMKRGMIKNLVFDRRSAGLNERILNMSVKIDSSAEAANSFAAVRSAESFIENGFRQLSDGGQKFYGPDADVLLDPKFTDGYCFSVRSPNKQRPRQVGLGFTPARTKQGRVDIDGTLWVDTSARVVKDIEFRYLGLPRRGEELNPGGQISFEQMPNGTMMIDRWSFRLVDTREDTATGRDGRFAIRTYPYLREQGGEVARAAWDGGTWEGALGEATIRVVDEYGRSSTRTIVKLMDTDYMESTDANGIVRFKDLLPGPYTLSFVDTALAARNIIIGSTQKFTAQRSKLAFFTATAPSPDVFLKKACVGSLTNRWVDVKATDSTGKRIVARWKLGEYMDTPAERVIADGLTGPDGMFGFCRDMQQLAPMEVRIARADQPDKYVRYIIPPMVSPALNMVVPPNQQFRVVGARH